MNVLLKGGPLDGEVRQAPTDGYGNPVEIAYFLPPTEAPIRLATRLKPNECAVEIQRYKLHEIWDNKKLIRYEYHYQGR